MEKSIKSNFNDSAYISFTNEVISFYNQIHQILLINLNDIFKKASLSIFKNNKLISDTITILEQNNYNLNFILKNNTLSNVSNDNKFIELTLRFYDIINNHLIIKMEGDVENVNLPKNKKTLFKVKKEHEVERLSNFIKTVNTKKKIDVFLEMGCGKSYLTEALMSENPKSLYIGIDMKENLVVKSSKQNTELNRENVYVLNGLITASNFDKFYTDNIQTILTNKGKSDNNIFLFGLHSCGNLTSDTMKMFIKYKNFSNLAVVSCCLNLLTEYISPEAKSSQIFQNYYNSVGYDMKGNFLEKTLYFEYNREIIGYPLSEYFKNKYPSLFLSRAVRNSAMQKATEANEVDSLIYRKMLYRTQLQALFEIYIPELSKCYGFAKIDISENDTFKEYVLKILNELNYKDDINIKQKIDTIKNNIDSTIATFSEVHKDSYKIFWAVELIRMKFAKVIEYLIALDRVIFLKENGIPNVNIINIFKENISTRNILIYASKD